MIDTSLLLQELLDCGFKIDVARTLLYRHLRSVKRKESRSTYRICLEIISRERKFRNMKEDEDFPVNDLV